MQKNLCEKCCVWTVIYSDKCGKTAVRETVDAEINNVIYMELYSGAMMADGKYRKTYVAGLIDRENTVHGTVISHVLCDCAALFLTLWEEHCLREFETWVLGAVCGRI
jgi:hypothetical protein